ncbi:MAG: hypothetical protein ABMB14_18245, partial [Myxococcota bacterium]
MKVCQQCGDSYKGHVDFCFRDGEVLVAADATGQVMEADLEAPMPRRVQGPQAAAEAVPVMRASPRSPERDHAPDPTQDPATPTMPQPVPQGSPGAPGVTAAVGTTGASGAVPNPGSNPPAPGAEPVPGANTPAEPIDDDTAPRPAQSQSGAATGSSPLPPAVPVPPVIGQTVVPLTPSTAATPVTAESREMMRVAPVPSEAETPLLRPPRAVPSPVGAAAHAVGSTPKSADSRPAVSQRLGGIAAAVPPEPGTDRSNLLMFGFVAVVAAMFVPFVTGGLAVYW